MSTVRDRAGRIERRRSHVAALRRPDLRRFYGHRLADVTPGAWTFRLVSIAGRGVPGVTLDHAVESFDWADEQAVLTGTVSLKRPDPQSAGSLPIDLGYRVRCDVRWRGSWYQLWVMKAGLPSINLADASVVFPLEDDLILLHQTKRDWSYRQTRQRKRLWTCDEIVRHAARREGLTVGTLARGTHRQRYVKKGQTFLDLVRAVYQFERDKSGRRFVIRMRNGRLEVIPLRRNEILYEFADDITGALLTQEGDASPVTVLTGRGHVGKGKAARKVKYTEARRALVRRFGRVTKEKDYGRVTSLADLKAHVKRDYAKGIAVKRTATLTVPCVPFIRRGDGIRWVTPEAGWHGATSKTRDRGFVFCSAVRHSVAPGSQSSELDVIQDDPYVKDALRLDKELRDKARERRKKRQRGQHG